jgi:hypothetical protein
VPVPRQKCATLQDKVERLVGGIILICIYSIEEGLCKENYPRSEKFPAKGKCGKYSTCHDGRFGFKESPVKTLIRAAI